MFKRGQYLSLRDHGKDLVAVAVELGRADARDSLQLQQRLRLSIGDLGERRVVEDDVGGDAVLLRSLQSPSLESAQERATGRHRHWSRLGANPCRLLRAE